MFKQEERHRRRHPRGALGCLDDITIGPLVYDDLFVVAPKASYRRAVSLAEATGDPNFDAFRKDAARLAGRAQGDVK